MKQEYPMHVVITSVIGEDDCRESFTSHTCAKLTNAGGKYTLSFTEAREGGRVYTTLTYLPNGKRVHQKCRGGVKSEIVFDPATVHTSVYEISPLKFDLTVTCHEVEAKLDELGGEIRLVYTRELAGDAMRVDYRLTATHEEVDA